MRRYLFLLLFTFIFVSLFGMNVTMRMDKYGKMPNCPLMNSSSSFCQMSITDHIAKWKALFEATPQLNAFFLLLALFSVTIFIRYITVTLALAPPSYSIHQLYEKESKENNLFNYLVVAFSDGILHPKIYS